MIRAVVWDMGGVFHRYFTEVLVDVGVERGWPLERIPLGPTGRTADPDYDRMIEGEILEADYLALVLERLAREGIDFDPIGAPDWEAEYRDATWDAIHRIHDSDLVQGILTNDATKWYGDPRWWERWERSRWFDAVVDVATLKVRKPHRDTYVAAAEALGVEPGDCVFVDDMPVNCRGAEAAGMESHWFDITSPQQAIESLLKRIGLDP